MEDTSPVWWRSAGRLASVSLALVLLALAASALFGALSSYRAGEAARRATDVKDAFEEARYFVGAEESLERKYRLEPGPDVRARHRQAGVMMLSAMARARALGAPADVEAIDDVIARHKQYLLSIDHMFAAIDRNDAALATKIDGAEVDPTFDAIESIVEARAAAHRADAAQHLNDLSRVQRVVLVATPIVFALGVSLVVSFWLLLRGSWKRASDSLERETATLASSEKRFRSLVQNASDVILICDPAGNIAYQSPAVETAWGYGPAQLQKQEIVKQIHPDDRLALRSLWEELLAAPGATGTSQLRIRDAVGDWRHIQLILTNLVDEPGIGGMVATARDITERKTFEEQLTRQAFYDSLTGLPNRVLLQDRLEQALCRVDRRRGGVGVLFVDLDNFKQINDSLGHKAGDRLLVEAATRLQDCVSEEDTVARLGGDEFVILLAHLSGAADAVRVAERIAHRFNRHFSLDGHEVVVTPSVGIALGGAGQRAESLLRHADVAMYRAKSGGKARHVIFDDSMQVDALSKLELENDLRVAVERGELRVNYQPIVLFETGRIAEAEALLHWNHPTRGLTFPTDFIAIAEDTGLIIPIGQWVLTQACRQAAAWQAGFPANPPLTISVNLSPRQFQQTMLVESVKSALSESGLAPSSLKLEITEGVIMRDIEATIGILRELKALGVQIAVDDFGTGYSSLSYLKRLPLDVIKIDRSFVTGIGHNPEDTAIVQAIIAMAKSLNLSVTGEGVETAEQSDLLRAWGCDRGQGYLFARPLEARDLAELLRAARPTDHRIAAA